MLIPSHCSCKNRDCELTKPLHSNLCPVELCAFACLGALNHDRPIVACPDLALWQYCWLCWAKVSGRSETMQNWRRISLKTSRRLKLVAWIQVEFRFGKILAPLCTGMYIDYIVLCTPQKNDHMELHQWAFKVSFLFDIAMLCQSSGFKLIDLIQR